MGKRKTRKEARATRVARLRFLETALGVDGGPSVRMKEEMLKVEPAAKDLIEKYSRRERIALMWLLREQVIYDITDTFIRAGVPVEEEFRKQGYITDFRQMDYFNKQVIGK